MWSRGKRQCRRYLTTPVCVALCVLAVVFIDWRLRAHHDRPARSEDEYAYNENSMASFHSQHHELQKSPTVRKVETTRGKKLLRLRYRPPRPAGNLPLGAGFFLDEDLVKTLNLPPAKLFYLNRKTAENFVFLTAGYSKTHEDSEAVVASIQHHKPGQKIVYYDMGLTAHQANAIKDLCHVIYRKFPFEKYPVHVRDLERFAWKQLVIQETLQEFGGVFWFEHTQRLLTANLDHAFIAAVQSGGIVHFKTTAHSNYAAIDSNTYQFLPTVKEKQMVTRQVTSSAILIYNTEGVFWNVLIWWYLCALELRCQSAPEVHKCHFKQTEDELWGNHHNATCSLFDQSVLNLLESNYYGYNFHKYTYLEQEIVASAKGHNSHYHLKKC